MSDFTTHYNRTARKQRKCCECRGAIQPGQKYERVFGVWDGHAGTYDTCNHCVEARDWATKQPEWQGDGEHLYYFTMLSEDLVGLADELRSGDGRKFKAYRLHHKMNKRRADRIEASQPESRKANP